MAQQPRRAPSPAVMRGRRDPALSVEQATEEAEQQQRRRQEQQRLNRQRQQVAARVSAGPSAPAPQPPADALYTVASGAPAPTARGSRVRLSEDRVHVVGAWDATLAQLQEAVDAPDDFWTVDLGRTDHFLRGELCVQVTRTEGAVVGIFRSGWATARRPEQPLPEEPGSAPRASGKQGTRYPTTQRDLLERLRAAGFEVTTSGPTHGKITHPELPFASTPSTSRHGRHMVTAVRRVFGIDLRDRP